MRAVNSVVYKDSLYSKAVLKTLNILDQFKNSDELGIKDLADATGIPPSTVQRMVNTLVMRHYLQKSYSGQKYKLGSSLFDISIRCKNICDQLDLAKQYMEEFTAETRENINLAVLSGSRVTYIAKVDSPELLRPDFQVGKPYPAFVSSLGRCMLAHQPWSKVEALYDSQEYKSISKDDFRTILNAVLKNGFATESEQFQAGLWCAAAPVRDRSGNVTAALSTCIPLLRLDENRKAEMCRLIVETADLISNIMK